MKNLKDILNDYKQEIITKADYIDTMHEKHQLLFEYQSFIKGTDIGEITISDSSIFMKTKNKNIKMLCDRYDKRITPIEILNFGSYEQECLDMMLRLIKTNSTIFDIGANVGWYSMNFVKQIVGVKVYAFEPMPKTFDYLTHNIKINNLSNISKYNIGLSNEEKEVIFYYDIEGSGNSSMANLSGKRHIKEIRCKVTTIDQFTKKENIGVDFIKCDVEGAELFVFTGGEETLKQYKPIIFTEMLRKWSAKFHYHPNEIINLLKNIGYRCFVVKEKHLEEFYSMDENTVETNFFFLHDDKHREDIAFLSKKR
ncbi:FkbM family methyltransferase [Sporomusa acidovorans]|uniref:Methyltransferase FkbM domain-containing protein n=1 Tax=Sporomusa acidovorans (strain ATCC 49682 / DSM 3132 / Mol) TaxID=1123286 RepID=A0ABZ3J7G0_SPOA4|nr:FkbM family methyltransferase [Sporomusa acidovorans]OZC23487.1 2-O-methyltransferase NoeI [Sporomusa acidovorans DSM 3132]SDF28331.1 methyltransferase, FkbM family [Sporomusa acidovorans]